MKKHYWLIQGYADLKPIFEMKVGQGQFTNDKIQQLLRALAAKENLSYVEIVGAYAKRRTKISNDLLVVHYDMEHSTYSCGFDPVFTVRVVDEDGKIIIYPKLWATMCSQPEIR